MLFVFWVLKERQFERNYSWICFNRSFITENAMWIFSWEKYSFLPSANILSCSWETELAISMTYIRNRSGPKTAISNWEYLWVDLSSHDHSEQIVSTTQVRSEPGDNFLTHTVDLKHFQEASTSVFLMFHCHCDVIYDINDCILFATILFKTKLLRVQQCIHLKMVEIFIIEFMFVL